MKKIISALILLFVLATNAQAQIYKGSIIPLGKYSITHKLFSGGKTNNGSDMISLVTGAGLNAEYDKFIVDLDVALGPTLNDVNSKTSILVKTAIMAHLHEYFNVGYVGTYDILGTVKWRNGYRMRINFKEMDRINVDQVFIDIEGFYHPKEKYSFVPSFVSIGAKYPLN